MCQRARPRKVHLHPLSRAEIDATGRGVVSIKSGDFTFTQGGLFHLRRACGDGSTLNETYVLEAALRQAEIWLSPGELNAEETMTLLRKNHHDSRHANSNSEDSTGVFHKR